MSMVSKIKQLMIKYQDLFMYGIFGVLTTAVNIVSFWLLAHPFGIGTMTSTILAWILSVCFAYVTNRKWVFHSNAVGVKAIASEIVSFFACRVVSGIVDWVCMLVFVTVLSFHDVITKVLVNVVVIILNYISSKLIIFNQKDNSKGEEKHIHNGYEV